MARRETPAAGPGSRALVVDVIRSAGTISRVELAGLTGLTQPSISMIVRILIADGVVHETGSAGSVRGKPRKLLAITPAGRFGIGFHLGVDALTCVAVDLTGGVVGREVVPLDGDDPGGDDVAARLADRFRDFTDGLDLPTSRIEGLAIVAATARPGREAAGPDLNAVRAELAGRLGIPVLVENDAAAAALGEFWSRRVSRDQSFAGIYLSTGIGAGLVFGGALFRGTSVDAGELGHFSIHYDGRPCPCGNRGCVERYASMTAVADTARADADLAGRLRLEGSVPEVYDAVARAAVSGDPGAYALLDEAAGRLAVAAASMVNLLDVGRLVLTGPGVAVAGSIFAQRVRGQLARSVHARHRREVMVELSAQPRDAASIGAAALVVQASIAPAS
ncbi:ROK family transcriptional regulator [Winogradskya humida]|uniref:Sugar kinase n=1 Tax=Winogradskya humida TaxID=113566 RepID=A0ABQ3ZYD0_9ACTN|nr:ROK family protein [Actinoplanes humidus]GIE23594.1 sugar kinase [Actinoplanes humidus]